MGEIDWGHGQWADAGRYHQALALQKDWEALLAWECSEEGLQWLEASLRACGKTKRKTKKKGHEEGHEENVPQNTPADDADLRRSPGDLGLVAHFFALCRTYSKHANRLPIEIPTSTAFLTCPRFSYGVHRVLRLPASADWIL